MKNLELSRMKSEMIENRNRKHRNSSVRVDALVLLNDFQKNKMKSTDECVRFFRTRFAGIDIPKDIIVTAVNRCFNNCTSQAQLNESVTRYLLNNLSKM